MTGPRNRSARARKALARASADVSVSRAEFGPSAVWRNTDDIGNNAGAGASVAAVRSGNSGPLVQANSPVVTTSKSPFLQMR